MFIRGTDEHTTGIGFLSPELSNAINSSLEIAGSLQDTVKNIALTREQLLNPPTMTIPQAQVMPAVQTATKTPKKKPVNWPLIIMGGGAVLGLGIAVYLMTRKPKTRRNPKRGKRRSRRNRR